MKNKTLKTLSVFLSFIIIFTSAAFTVSSETAEVTFKLFAKNFNNEAFGEITEANPLEVWVNGGRASYSVPETDITYDVEHKAIAVELYAYYGSNSIDMTKGKNYFWLLATDSTSKGKTTTAKPKNTNDYITVSVGKITAKKSATPDNKPAYAGIYTYDKKTKIYTCVAVFPIVVKQAPAKLSVHSIQNSAYNANKLSTVSTGLNETSRTVYINPLNSKNLKTDISLSALSYKIDVNNKNTAIVYTDASGTEIEAGAGETVTMQADSSGGINFVIKGLAITKDTKNAVNSTARQDKTASSAVTVTNLQSGKSVKLTATVGNNVTAVAALSSDGLSAIPISETDANGFSVSLSTHATVSELDSRTFDLLAKGLITLNDSDGTVTATPTIGVYKAKAASDGIYTYKDFTTSDGTKLSFPTANKSDDISLSLVGKDNYHIKISAKKKADYAEALTHYAVLAYGTTADTILIIPVNLSSPSDELTGIKIGTYSYSVSGSGVYPNVIKLDTGISNGAAFLTTSKLGLAPSITLTNGASYSTSIKKLKLADDKQTIMKLVYGTSEYYFTVSGKTYVSQPLKSVYVKGTGEGTHTFDDNFEQTIEIHDFDSDGVKVEFVLSDGTKLNNYSSEITYIANGTEAVFDKSTSMLTGLKTGETVQFDIFLSNVKVGETKSDLKYTIYFKR